MKKEMIICDICKEDLGSFKCDICGKDVCKKHSKIWSVSLGSGIMTKITLCTGCIDEIQYSRGMENNQEFKRILLEFIKKQMIMDKLKDGN